ncbi:MAG: ABC transporter substrate-binding protein [Betaproteobacteria bacterium]
MKTIAALAVAALAGLAMADPAAAQTQGVSDKEIVIATIQDLSGPLAGYGKQARNGLQMRVDEINEAGGVRGRKLRFLVEDNGYDPKKALLAAQKLSTDDKVFAIVSHIGTAANMAAMPIQFERNVINFLPLSGARQMFDPFHPLKIAFATPYFDQLRVFVPQLAKEKGAKKIGIIYKDDETGLEMLRGTEAGLKTIGLSLVEKTSFKRGATDFSSQVAKLAAAGCDLVVLGTIIRETVGTVAEARKIGFNPTFIGSSAMYTNLIHQLGGKAVEGVYAAHTVAHPYLDEQSKPVAEWAARYKAKFGEDPTVFSAYGYTTLDMFAKAADKAGQNLTTESFIAVMESTTFPPDIFGSPEFRITKTNRLGINEARLSQIQNGRWKVTSKYLEVRPE